MKTATSIATLVAVIGLSAGAANAQEGYFAGKSIDVIVPFGPGGATFVSAKFLEPYFEKHLPGNPEINVIDRPGGGSILGANWFEQNAKSDGTTILFTTSSTANPFVLGQKGVEYKLADYRVAYSHPFSAVAYTSPSTGVTSAADIKSSKTPLVYGGIAAAASDLPGLLSFELLGLDVKSVLGFNGRGPVRLAFEQGEVNIDYQFTPVYLTQVVPSVEEGTAVPLWTGGSADADGKLTQRDPIAPELPSVYEVYEPQEVLDIFAQAVADINADPEFQAESQKVTNGARLSAGPATEKAIKAALSPSDEVRAYLKNLLTTKFGVKF